jgi:hypothetical protein
LASEDAQRIVMRRIEALEQERDVRLTGDHFLRARELIHSGTSAEEAFEYVQEELAGPAAEQWRADMQKGIDQIEAKIGRELTTDEIIEVIEAHKDDPGDDDEAVYDVQPDALAAWQERFGAFHSPEEIEAPRLEHDRELDKLRNAQSADGTPMYSDDYIAAWERESLAKVEQHQAEMRASGQGILGQFDTSTEAGRRALMQARLADIREAEGPDASDLDVPEPPGPDSTAAQRIAWANARLSGTILHEDELPDDDAPDEPGEPDALPPPTSPQERVAAFNEGVAQRADEVPPTDTPNPPAAAAEQATAADSD